MSTVNYSVPEEIKAAFNKTFEGQDKSAIVAELMRKAVQEAERKTLQRAIFEEIDARRRDNPPASLDEILATRDAMRE